jgi:osmoprotectant transport system permease protein
LKGHFDLLQAAAFGAALALLLAPPEFIGRDWLSGLNAEGVPALYVQDSLFRLTLWHAGTAISAVALATILALLLAIWVTRPVGKEVLPLARALSEVGQAFPPVTLLAIAVPIVGFGFEPTFFALLAYGLLPVFENALTGLRSVPAGTLDAARGAGMSPGQVLGSIELPLAGPVILTGVRISAAFSIGTATLGSTVGAKGLGEVIIAGLQSSNLAFIAQGALAVSLLALLVDRVIVAWQKRLPAVRATLIE